MLKSLHRRMSWAVALGYVLASTCLGTWHSHADGPHACTHAVGDSLTCGHDGDEHALNHGGNDQVPDSSEGDCVVCRFLAQSALPVPTLILPMLGEIVAEARVAQPGCPVVWVAMGGPPRAPPSVA